VCVMLCTLGGATSTGQNPFLQCSAGMMMSVSRAASHARHPCNIVATLWDTPRTCECLETCSVQHAQYASHTPVEAEFIG